jgi:hypothetical protein
MNPINRDKIPINRPYTYWITFVCLFVGVMLAVPIALVLLTSARPLTLNDAGEVSWSLGAFALPAAMIIVAAIMWIVIFPLPRRIANMRGIVLDPDIYPATGAIAAGVLLGIAFVLAMLAGVI